MTSGEGSLAIPIDEGDVVQALAVTQAMVEVAE
jgi:hypothetical protein